MRNIFLLSILFISFSVNALAQKNNILSPEEFSKVLKDESNIVLLDVRTLEEFNDGHLQGAANYDMKSKDFAKQIEHLNPNKTYYIYCKTGKRSAAAAKKMRKIGIKEVYELDGGITKWKQDGFQTIRRNKAD